MSTIPGRLTVRAVLVLCVLLVSTVACATAGQPAVRDSVRLKATSSLGVPLHAREGETGVSGRLPDGTVATIEAIGTARGWVLISGGGQSGWIIDKYFTVIPSGAPAPAPAPTSYIIGSWNLEWLHDGKSRGFPEYLGGGPTYPERTQANYEFIASTIEELDLKIVVLQEINGFESIDGDGERVIVSAELDRLVSVLGSANYEYVLAPSGGNQHVAMLFDRRAVRLNESGELDVPNTRVQNKSLFARRPFAAHFTLLVGGVEMNDLTVVGLHLAAGQHLNRNHDRAMEELRRAITRARAAGALIPPGEGDILLTGDLNCNRFDEHHETFWDDLESDGWDVLADDQATYPATRLSGHPLALRDSRIDYIVISAGAAGLAGHEITQAVAHVHTELLPANPEDFRRQASDHLPVTVSIRVVPDDDP